jgi:hypothetical protein
VKVEGSLQTYSTQLPNVERVGENRPVTPAGSLDSSGGVDKVDLSRQVQLWGILDKAGLDTEYAGKISACLISKADTDKTTRNVVDQIIDAKKGKLAAINYDQETNKVNIVINVPNLNPPKWESNYSDLNIQIIGVDSLFKKIMKGIFGKINIKLF